LICAAKFVSVSACTEERIVLRCQPNHYITVYTAEWQSADSIPGLPGCVATEHLQTGSTGKLIATGSDKLRKLASFLVCQKVRNEQFA